MTSSPRQYMPEFDGFFSATEQTKISFAHDNPVISELCSYNQFNDESVDLGALGWHGSTTFNNDFFTNAGHPDSLLNATPSSMESILHTPPTSTADRAQLVFSPTADPLLSFLSPPGGYEGYSSATPVKEEVLLGDFATNALGLFDGSGTIAPFPSSPALLPDLFHTADNGQCAITPNFSGNSLLSPISSAATNINIGIGLPSPIDGTIDIRAALGMTTKEDLNPPVINPEQLYPSPFPTPQRPSTPLPPDGTTRKARTGKAKKSRASASARRTKDSSAAASTMTATPARPSSSRIRRRVQEGGTITKRSSDECLYGRRVWVTKGDGLTEKWECRFCGRLLGRRPDLHRHYKTCVTREKSYCEDVEHADGSVWTGCGEKFSRRDAYHRHLRRRFTGGRCISSPPKPDRFHNEEDYQMRVALYEDSLLNFKWRADLPKAEKNRLAWSVMPDMKRDMFE